MDKFKRYLILVLASCLLSINYNLFILPNLIVVGGISGLGVVMEDFINPSFFIFGMNLCLLCLSMIFLGLNKTKDFLLGSLLFPIFIYITADVNNYFSSENIDFLLLIVISAVIAGFSIGTIIKNGFSTGGVDIAASILSKFFNKSMGNMIFLIDGLIILVGAYRFGIEKLFYAIVFVYILSMVIDRIILGISANKAFYIITNEEKKIKDYIINHLGHGATILNAKGGLHYEKKNILFCVVPTSEYFRLRTGINKIDQDAFFIVTDAYEVQGGA